MFKRLSVLVVGCLLACSVHTYAATEGIYTYTVLPNNTARIDDVDVAASGDLIVPSILGSYQVTVVGDRAFSSMVNLTSVTLPNSITSLEYRAFYNNPSIVNIQLGNAITNFATQVFRSCTSLESIVLPDSLTYLPGDGYGVFEQCDSLTNAVLGNAVTNIGIWTFYSCDSLESITIPDSVISLGPNAFGYCVSLTNVNFGANSQLQTIGDAAFQYCGSLESISIPDSVMTIGAAPFRGTSSLTNIFVSTNNNVYASIDGVMFTKDLQSLLNYPLGRTDLYVVPAGVTNLAASAFESSRLSGVTLPDTLLSIDGSAFNGCTNLYSVTFGANSQLQTINSSAFRSCSSLASITIPDGVTSLGSYAFQFCANLTNVMFEANSQLQTIGTSAFQSCSSLESISIPDSVTSLGNYVFQSCTNLTNVMLGANSQLQTISNSAFQSCSSLENITIPDSVTSLGSFAFQYCSSLTNVNFGANSQLQTINSSAFRYCSSLESISIPDSVTSLGSYAFYQCSELEYATFGTNITSIGNYSFRSCPNLASVFFDGNALGVNSSVFLDSNSVYVYYDSATSGWGSTLAGRPAVARPYDRDNDGVSDYAEHTTYGTSPLSADSDGDGILDGREVGVDDFYVGSARTYSIVYTDPLTWEEAQIHAQSLGGYVATIVSSSEWEYVYSELGNQFEDHWIGGYSGSDSQWKWWGAGETWSYDRWAVMEPIESYRRRLSMGTVWDDHEWFSKAPTDTDDSYILEKMDFSNTDPLDPDSDNDGATDGDELLAGTSPNSTNEVFEIMDPPAQPSESGMVLRWQTVSNRTYYVYTKTSLMDVWAVDPVYQVDGDGSTVSFTNALPGVSRYFRIGVSATP